MARRRPGIKAREAVALVRQHAHYNHSINPEQFQILLEALGEGCGINTAAKVAGWTPATIYAWVRDGELDPENSMYRDVAKLVRLYQGKATRSAYKALQAGHKKDWRAAESFLKHTAREEFYQSKAVEVSGPNGGPVQLTVAAEALELLRSALGERSEEELETLASEVDDADVGE